MAKILFCTVGGSHQPIVKAIAHHQPDRTYFICSEDDPVTQRAGSYTQISGAGSVCTSAPGKPADLPNIPTQAGLSPERYEVIRVPADEAVEAIGRILPILKAEVAAYGKGQVTADYTGGTKGMTAALFFAAVHTPGVSLHNVGGPRSDLIKVVDGTERVKELKNAHRLLLPVRLEEVERAWRRFSYNEAAHLLEGMADTDEPIADRLLTASRGYEAWALGRHGDALTKLKVVSHFVPETHLAALSQMQLDNARGEVFRIYDLLLGAERDAATGHYDTAILSSYRAFEAIAQWSLKLHHGILTGDAPADQPALEGLTNPGNDGKLKLGLDAAWTALGRLGGPLAAVGQETERSRRTFASLRNQSRFAHGTEPVDAQVYARAQGFMDSQVIPAFLRVAFKGTVPFTQLPRTTEAFR